MSNIEINFPLQPEFITIVSPDLFFTEIGLGTASCV